MKFILLMLFPFLGTTIGSFFVFFVRKNINKRMENIMIGLSSGVMLSASLWSLLIPSLEFSNHLGCNKWIPPIFGFILGIIALLLIDKIVCNFQNNKILMPLVVTIHNIPEGLVVGILIVNAVVNNNLESYMSALTLSVGIAIQNIPEGAIISLSLNSKKTSKFKSFLLGVLSGAVEPLSILLTLVFMKIISTILPYSLSFASGAMIYVVIEELLPSGYQKSSKILIISFSIGFIIMMFLDIVF